jgi:hypothetical protein
MVAGSIPAGCAARHTIERDQMKIPISAILGVSFIQAAFSFDATPIGLFSYEGKFTTEAKITGVTKEVVTVTGKNNTRIEVPLSAAVTMPQLAPRIEEDLEKFRKEERSNKVLLAATKEFRVIKVLKTGMICEEIRRVPDVSAASDPAREMGGMLSGADRDRIPTRVDYGQKVFLSGYSKQEELAAGSTFKVPVAANGTKNLGADYHDKTLPAFLAR